MSPQQVTEKAFGVLNVLFDAETTMLLGKGGKWMTATEFERNPPQKPEDLVPPPTPENEPIEDPDPGPTYKCINGFLHCCNGLVCTRVLKNGQPVRCP